MQYVYLAVAAIAPLVLIAKGKRLMGNQTHPAAVFILAWILCGYFVGLAEIPSLHPGGISFVWVALCFPMVRLARQRSAQTSPSPNPADS